MPLEKIFIKKIQFLGDCVIFDICSLLEIYDQDWVLFEK